MNNILALIPARYASTRFPGKPLAMLGGKTMIERVYERASQVFPNCCVATDDCRIADAVKAFGGKAVMTRSDHKSGTDRCAEALDNLSAQSGEAYNVVINIQGDEPFIVTEQLSLLASCFDDPATQIATLVKPITNAADLLSPNKPKVVLDSKSCAIYFSREPIPHLRGEQNRAEWLKRHTYYNHIGLYAYRADVLRAITKLPQGKLEVAESLEQLRWLEAGYKIATRVTQVESYSIDTPEDLEHAVTLLHENQINGNSLEPNELDNELEAEEFERVALVAVRTPDLTQRQVDDYLDELAFLAETAGAKAVKRFTQNLPAPDTRTYVGAGRLEEIKAYVEENEIETVIVDDELSPSQQRNIEKTLGCQVLDRTSLILDIFATRARTAHAKTQVELAQYQYLLPRLTRMWTHLDRQKGGIGMRGTGEKQIETDRRIVLDKIALLKEDLKHIDRQMQTQRQNRGKLVRVALVGYTNVGKSTLMNAISKTNVFAENKLFATLDTTVRKVVIANLPFLMADTVGFIRKLPTNLIESFKSTLDEVREADLLLHVVDISHPAFEQQVEVVNKTIHDISGAEKPTILVFNKIDAFNYTPQDEDDLSPKQRENFSLEDLKKTWMASGQKCVFISAREKNNFEELRNIVYSEVKKIHVQRFPYNDFLYDEEFVD